VHDDTGVQAAPVQLGVDVDGRGDVPPAVEHGTITVHCAQIRGLDLLPPQAPRVHQHLVRARGRDRDVPGDVLGEPAVGQDPERTRQRLPLGQFDADRRRDPRRPGGQATIPYWYIPHRHRHRATSETKEQIF
jgi:hypothetical protein